MTDAIAGAIWFAVNAIAVSAAWRVARRVARRALAEDSAAQTAMHTLVMLWSAIAGICLLLGGLGMLTAGAMGALMFALALAVHLLGVRRFIAAFPRRGATFGDGAAGASGALSRNRLPEKPDRGIGYRPEFLRILLHKLRNATEGVPYRHPVQRECASPSHLEAAKAAAPQENAALNRRAPTIVWGALAALAGGMVVQRLLGFPEHWDDLMYHLPFVDHWWQDHSIFHPATSEWTNACNAEFIGLWLVAPFSGDFWIGAANLPVVALLALGMLELGRELGLTPLMRHAIAIAALATNVVLIQLTDLENDTAAAALFVAGLAYAARYARTGRVADLALCACALGLLPGVKYYALGYAAVAAVTAVALAWSRRGSRAAWRLTAAGVAAGMVLSGYWYARNWIVTGTPVFPLGISSETDVLKAVNPDTYAHTFFGNGRATLWVQYVGALWRLAGPCQVAAAVFAPATALWSLSGIVFCDKEHNDAGQRQARAALAAAFCASVMVFSITPYTVSDDDVRKINGDFVPLRYSECAVALALVVMGVALDDIGRALARFSRNEWQRAVIGHCLGVVVAAAAIVQVVVQCRGAPVGDALLIAVNLGLAAWLTREMAGLRIWSQRRALLAAATLAMVSAGSSWWLSERWHAGYAKNFDRQFATKAFSRLESGQWPAARIGVADYRYYPFFGSRRQFRAHRPFRLTTRSSLDDYLQANRIDFLAVVRNDFFRYGRYHGVAEWVKQDTARFEKVESAGSFDCYRVAAEHSSPLAPREESQTLAPRAQAQSTRLDSLLNPRVNAVEQGGFPLAEREGYYP